MWCHCYKQPFIKAVEFNSSFLNLTNPRINFDILKSLGTFVAPALEDFYQFFWKDVSHFELTAYY